MTLSILLPLIAFLIATSGILYAAGGHEDRTELGLNERPKSLQSVVHDARKRKKTPITIARLQAIRFTLDGYGKRYLLKLFVILAMILAVLLTALCLCLGLYAVLPAAILLGIAVPSWGLILMTQSMDKSTRNELEIGMNLCAVSFVRTLNLVESMQEAAAGLHGPVKDAFQAFCTEVQCVNPDMETAIHNLENKFSDAVFDSFCEALLQCIKDRSFLDTLMPIVKRKTDERRANEEVKGILKNARTEFFMMAGMVVGNVPLLYLLNREWFRALVGTVSGHVVMSISLSMIAVCATLVLLWTAPVRYGHTHIPIHTKGGAR